MRKRAAGTALRSRMPQLTFAAKKETRDSLAAHLTVSLELFCANNWVKYVNYTLCPLFHISKSMYSCYFYSLWQFQCDPLHEMHFFVNLMCIVNAHF